MGRSQAPFTLQWIPNGRVRSHHDHLSGTLPIAADNNIPVALAGEAVQKAGDGRDQVLRTRMANPAWGDMLLSRGEEEEQRNIEMNLGSLLLAGGRRERYLTKVEEKPLNVEE